MKILVVEDDRAVRETLGLVLESYEHEVVLVSSGEEAITQLARDWPDLLLLDLSLVNMTGEEVYARIRQRFGRIPPTVVLSAVQHGEDRARSLPGVQFLAKPYTIDELLETVQRVGRAPWAA